MKFTYFIGIDSAAAASQKRVLTYASVLKNNPSDSSTESLPTQRRVVGNYLLGSKSTGCPAQGSPRSVFLCHGTHRLVHVGVVLLSTRDQQLAFALYSPLHLKRSLGLARGKNDRVDAQRIAHYAFLHRHQLTPTILPSASLLKLKNLFAFRERLVKNQTSLKQTIKDLKDTAHLVDNKFIIKQSEKRTTQKAFLPVQHQNSTLQ